MRYTTLLSKKYKVEIDKVRVNGYDAMFCMKPISYCYSTQQRSCSSIWKRCIDEIEEREAER